MMKILAISDLHGHLPYVPDCDVLLLAGDYCPTRNLEQERRFMLGKFKDWMENLLMEKAVKHIVGIGGNHDFILQEDRELAEGLPWHYLQDSEWEHEGVRIYGTPWTREFYNWAFMDTEDGLGKRFENIPEHLDILLTHGPAYGHLDQNAQSVKCGSTALLYRIEQAMPDSVVCGHIHEARGIEEYEGVRYYNVTYLNLNYEPKYNCMNIPLRVEK